MSFFGPPNIGEMKARHNIKGLIKALGHKDPDVAENARKALAEMKDGRSVELLIELLKHGNSRERYFAAHSLGNLDDLRAVKPLIAAFKHDAESSVQSAAEDALRYGLLMRHYYDVDFDAVIAQLSSDPSLPD